MNSSKSEFSDEKEEDAIVKKLAEIILRYSVKLNAQEIKINISLKEDVSEVFFIVEGEVQKIPPPPKVHLLEVIKYLRALSNLDPNMKYESESGMLSYQFPNSQRYEWNAAFKSSEYGEECVLVKNNKLRPLKY